ncbi:hypothetical protein [Streptomyces marinisediminis]|uniref:hypothetical protein n=1 Tax=Streptomyces TaxID=1883 RepID=UPI003A4C54D8
MSTTPVPRGSSGTAAPAPASDTAPGGPAPGAASGPGDGRRPGDALVRVGGVVFAAGALATLVTFVPFFLGTDPFPSYAYALSMLMGVGFALAGAGFWRGVRAQRHGVRAQAVAASGSPGSSGS